MTRPSILALVVIALTVPPAVAVDLPIARQVDRLGHRAYAQRERATKILRMYGPVSLPELRLALKNPDEEVRVRAEGLVRDLEIQAALEPKRITLVGGERPFNAVLAEIQGQTGYRMRALGVGANQAVGLDLKRVPFWDAMDRLGRATGQAVTLDTYGPELRFLPAKVASPYVQVDGPFRVEAQRLHEDRDAVFREPKPDGTAGATSHTLTLTLIVQAEPKLTLLSVGRPLIDRATDEAERAYTVVQPPTNVREYNGYEPDEMPIARPTQVRLQRADDKATRIAELTGSIPVKVVIQKKRVVVSEKPAEARGTRIRTGSGDLEISQSGEEVGNGGMFSLEVKVPVDGYGMPTMQWANRLKLEDANGNAFPSYGSGTRSTGREYWVRRSFQVNAGGKFGAPAKIVFEDWVTTEHAVPFTFKGIALP